MSSIVFNLTFHTNSTLTCFFNLLTYIFYFLQLLHKILILSQDSQYLLGIPTNEKNEEIKTQPVVAETKLSTCSM